MPLNCVLSVQSILLHILDSIEEIARVHSKIHSNGFVVFEWALLRYSEC